MYIDEIKLLKESEDRVQHSYMQKYKIYQIERNKHENNIL
jgi:hypothetical protein